MTATATESRLEDRLSDPIRVLLVDRRQHAREVVLADALVTCRPTPGDVIEFFVGQSGVPTHVREENGAWVSRVQDETFVRPGEIVAARCGH